MQQTITLRTFDDKSQLNDVILEILHRMYVRLHESVSYYHYGEKQTLV